MSALSAKARAFSVDQLLLKKEEQKLQDEITGGQLPGKHDEETCAAMGDEPSCHHKNHIEVLGK